jgi:hypothetical protein
MLSQSVSGGVIGGTATAATGVVTGKKQNIPANVGLGMMFGALGGAYESVTSARIQENFANLAQSFSTDDKEGLGAVDKLAQHMASKEKIPQAEAVKRIAKIYAGNGSDIDKLALQTYSKSNPELFQHPMVKRLLGEPDEEIEGSPYGVRIPKENEVHAQFDALKSDNPVDILSQGHSYKSEFADAPTIPPVAKQALESNGFSPQYFEPQPKEPIELTPDMVLMGPSTDAGRAVVSKAETFVLPPDAEVKDIPPAPKLKPPRVTKGMRETLDLATKTADWGTLEKRLAKNQENRASLGKLVVHGLLEPDAINSPNVANTIGNALRDIANALPATEAAVRENFLEHADDFSRRFFSLRGEEPPTGIEDPNWRARAGKKTVGPTVGDLSDRPERMRPAGGHIKAAETATYRVTSVGSRTRGWAYVRETESGDIMRTVRNADETTDIIDKSGKTAKVKTKRLNSRPRINKAVSPVNPGELVGLKDANTLKKVEIALNGETHPQMMPGPSPGVMPTPPNVDEVREKTQTPATKVATKKLSAAALKEKAVKLEKLLAEEMKAKSEPQDLSSIAERMSKPTKSDTLIPASMLDKLMKGLKENPKGAITFMKGKRIKGTTLANFAESMGHELWQTKDGFVTRDMNSGEERLHPNDQYAYGYLKGLTSEMRNKAEVDAVVDRSAAHLDQKSARRLLRAGVKAEKIPVSDLDKIAKFAQARGLLPGAERPPLLVRMGVIGPHSYLVRSLIRQNAELMTMGEGGINLGNIARLWGDTHEQVRNYFVQRVEATAKMLDSVTNVRELQDRKAPAEAQEAYRRIIGSTWMESYKSARGLGGNMAPLIEQDGMDYVHRHFDIGTAEIPASVIEEARVQGIAETPAEVAKILNDPDKELPAPKNTKDQKSMQDWLASQDWARKRGTSISHSLETSRRGNSGYTNSIYKSVMAKVNEDARRIADLSVFGPRDANLESAFKKIAGDADLGSERANRARLIMNDVRGRLHIPMSEGTKNATAAMKFWLFVSGPRHLANNLWTSMHFGVTPTMLQGLNVMAHGVGLAGEDAAYMRRIGAMIGRDSLDAVDEHVEELLKEGSDEAVTNTKSWSAAMGLPDWTKRVGRAGTYGLHVFLNGARLTAGILAKNTFNETLSRAMAGDADSLALLSEAFHAKVTPEFLASQDKEAMMMAYSKSAADVAGGTYRPDDYPEFSRSPVGQQLTRFKVFQWTLTHNIYQELLNPNYSYARRVKAAARLAIAIPLLGAADPAFRHATKTGNVDSEIAYKAITAALNDPTHVGKDAYAMIAMAINLHTMGLLSDAVQGINLLNPDITARSFIAQSPLLGGAADVAMGAARVVHGVYTNDPDTVGKGMEGLSHVFGPGVIATERWMGMQPPVRLPKNQLYREALGAEDEDADDDDDEGN